MNYWVGHSILPSIRKNINISVIINLTSIAQVILLNDNTVVRAKVIAVRTSSRMVDGISKAILVEQLKKKLRSGQIVKFAYLKKDGSIRIAFGTTNPDFIADKVCGWGVSREESATTAYYDLESGGWRSFRWENLIAVY